MDLGARPPGHLEVLSRNGVLRRMAKFIQTIAGGKIAVSIRPGDNVGKIFANLAHSEELIMKLVLHAVKSLAGGGQLTIETSAAGDHISLAVTPCGVRLSADFENVDSSWRAIWRRTAAAWKPSSSSGLSLSHSPRRNRLLCC